MSSYIVVGKTTVKNFISLQYELKFIFSLFFSMFNIVIIKRRLDFINWALLEKAMVSHSSTLAWKIPWMEEPGGLQSMGSRRVGHD